MGRSIRPRVRCDGAHVAQIQTHTPSDTIRRVNEGGEDSDKQPTWLQILQ